MPFIVNFEDYRPSARHTSPASFWTQAAIEEAPDATGEPGTFVQLEVKSVPAYTDQENPPTVSFTTEIATQMPGWYRIIFKDASGDSEYTAPLFFTGALSFRPSTRDIAKLVPTRTRGDTMQDQPDFSANSRPTRDEVEALAADAEAEVGNRLSSYVGSVPTKYHQKIRWSTTLYGAMLVELTKYPDQIGTQRSAYDKLKELYDESMTQLEQSLGIIPEGSTTGPTTGVIAGYGFPSYAFPEDRGGLVDWGTKF